MHNDNAYFMVCFSSPGEKWQLCISLLFRVKDDGQMLRADVLAFEKWHMPEKVYVRSILDFLFCLSFAFFETMF